jgi:capsular exopolysaccharide synthesis family protein
VESGQELFDALQLKLKEAGVMAGLASANISIVDRGKIPSRPVLPKKGLNLALGLLVGLFGGVGLAFALESLDDTVQTSEEVESVSSLPALAVVPWAGSRGHLRNGARRQLPAPQLAILSLQSPKSAGAEAYRSACSALLLSSVDTKPRLLVVTSALPQEGKSVTSCNLAIALAQRGGKVLLVDADLRRSSIHTHFGITTTEGLSSLLAGNAGQEAIQSPLAELPNLAVLPAGPHPPSPTEMLASNRLGAFLEKWSADYDHIVFDTAPMIPVADTLALAARADAVILVVRSGLSRKKALSRTRELLHRANAHVAGVILNGADLQLEHYYSYGYGYGYGYRSKSGYGSYYGDTNEKN